MRQARQIGLDGLQVLIKQLALPYLGKYWDLIFNTLQREYCGPNDEGRGNGIGVI
jgi:hypothetical protein